MRRVFVVVRVLGLVLIEFVDDSIVNGVGENEFFLIVVGEDGFVKFVLFVLVFVVKE